MPTTTAKDLRDKTDDLLIQFIGERRRELLDLRFANVTRELDNTARLNHAKREHARALTIAKERGLSVEDELRKHKNG